MSQIMKAARGVRAFALAILGCISVSLSWPAAMAQAQDGTPDAAPKTRRGVEEVIVSAQKYEQNLQDVPISITALSAQDIESKSVTGLKELAQFVPNLTFSNHSTSGNSGAIIYIRGVGQQDSGIEFDPGVGVYVDGIYMGRMQGLDLDLLDIKRIEILRGPQGTLFGKNTVGGALNITSEKPKDQFAASADVTVGSFDRLDGKVSLDLPLVPGKLAAKLVAASRNSDGYGKRYNFSSGAVIDEMGDRSALSGRALVEWTPTETLDVLFSGDASRSREHGNPHKLIAATQPTLITQLNTVVDPDFGNAFLTNDPFATYATGANKSDLDTTGASVVVTWDLGDWTAKSLTSYREVETLYGIDPDGSPYYILDSIQQTEQSQISQELLLTGSSFNDRLKSVFGVFYFDEEATSNRYTGQLVEFVSAFGVERSATTLQENNAESWSAFAHGTFDLTKKFSFTAGARFTEDKKDVEGSQFRPITGAIVAPLRALSGTWNAVTGRAGFEYRWTDEILTYASAARGFKSGGINSAGANAAQFVPFDPEYVWTYEVGVKSDLFDRLMRVNAAVFYSDYSNIQFRVRLPNVTFIDNAAKSRVQGFETEVVVAPAEGFTFNFGLGYTDAKYTAVEPGSPVTTRNKFVETPPWTVSVGSEYAMPINAASDLIAHVDYAYRTTTQHDLANNPLLAQDPYGLLNARLTYENTAGGWSVSLFGTNLTDERYFLGGIDFSSSLGWADVQYARPREWGATFSYSFD